MRSLIFLLLLAGTASASTITSPGMPDLTLMGADLSGVTASVTGGPSSGYGIYLSAMTNGTPADVLASITSYLTVTGGTGSGSMAGFIAGPSGCNAMPYIALSGCYFTYDAPAIFTYDLPIKLTASFYIGVLGKPYQATVSGLLPAPNFQAIGAPGAIFTYSTTAPTVANPEPGTLGLALVAASAFAGRLGLSALRQARLSRA